MKDEEILIKRLQIPEIRRRTNFDIIYKESFISIYTNQESTSPFKQMLLNEVLLYLEKPAFFIFNTLVDETGKKSYKNTYISPYLIVDIDGHSEQEKIGLIKDGGLKNIIDIIKNDKKCIYCSYSKSGTGIRAIYAVNLEPRVFISELNEEEIEQEKMTQKIKYKTVEEHLYNIGLENIIEYNDKSFFRRYSQGTAHSGKKIKARRLKENMLINIPDYIVYDIYSEQQINTNKVYNYDFSSTECSYTNLYELSEKDREKIDKHFSKHPIRYQDGVDFFRYRNADISTRRFLFDLFRLYYGGGSKAPRQAIQGGFDVFNNYIDNLMKVSNNSNQAHWLGFFSGLKIKNLTKNK